MTHDNIANSDFSACIAGKVGRISRHTSNIFRKHLKSLDITDSQLSILFVASKMGKISQKQISDFLYLEKSSVNRNIRRLLAKMYLAEDELPTVAITELGLSFVNDAVPAWRAAMDEIKEQLNNDGLDAIDNVLAKLSIKE